MFCHCTETRHFIGGRYVRRMEENKRIEKTMPKRQGVRPGKSAALPSIRVCNRDISVRVIFGLLVNMSYSDSLAS